jgi:hypothetical protein
MCTNELALAESIRRPHHVRPLWFQRKLLIRRASGIIVEALDVSVLATEGDVVESGNG